MTLNCLIIDDEPLAIELLKEYAKKIPVLNLIGTCEGALAATEHLNKGNIDLIFLDINMPDITGIQFLKSLKHKPAVIFVTAYQEYAVESYELDAIDYLLKPIPFDRFFAAVNKALEYLQAKKGKKETGDDFFFVKTAHKILKIAYDDILYFEGLKDYTKIHLTSQKAPVVTLQSLKYFETRMPQNRFLRIHRSYIVAIRKIQTISRKTIHIGDLELPCSEHYKDQLTQMVDAHL